MKSFTTIEKKLCAVTGKEYETNSLLIDKRMRDKFEMYTTTGWGISPEVQEKLDEGYMALIVADPDKSTNGRKATVKLEDAYRTGEVMYIKKEVASQIFSIPGTQELPPFTFIDLEAAELLRSMPHTTED